MRIGHLTIAPRWVFLLWIALVYAVGALGYAGAGWGTDCHRVAGLDQACFDTFFPALNAASFTLRSWPGPDLPAFLVYTACLAFVALLSWAVLARRGDPAWAPWPAFLLAGALVFVGKVGIQGDLVAFGDRLALALYAALFLQAWWRLRDRRGLVLVGAAYTILLLVGAELEGGWQYLWQARLPSIGYAVLLPPLVALVAVYLANVRAQRSLAAAHADLAAAYEQLAASARQIESLTLLTERQRIARELHDTLAQPLVGLVRQLDVAEAHLQLQHTDRALRIVRDTSACRVRFCRPLLP